MQCQINSEVQLDVIESPVECDFTNDDISQGNFIATLQLMANNSILQKHLSSTKRNSKYTSKTIQNEIDVHVYAMKIKEKLTEELRSQKLPFTIIVDECKDRYSKQEILSV